MKKGFLTAVFLAMVLVVSNGQVFSNDTSEEKIIRSAHDFVRQLYEYVYAGDERAIAQCNCEESARERLEYWRVKREQYGDELERLEFLESMVVSESPLIVVLYLKEWIITEPDSLPYYQMKFTLKDMGNHNWRVIEMKEPAL
jgi:hypothetical protein